ncbi:hypothetical protein ACO1NJ_13760, partial [Staphylococcus aureus]
RNDAFWFGEAQGRVVVSVNEGTKDLFVNACVNMNIPYLYLGVVTDSKVTVQGEEWGDIADWKDLYDTAIEKIIG